MTSLSRPSARQRRLTFLSVAQRLSLSSDVQAQVCGLQHNTQTWRWARCQHFHTDQHSGGLYLDLECKKHLRVLYWLASERFIPHSRPLVPSWRVSWWVLQRDVSCSPGVCPLTYGTILLRHRWLRTDGVTQGLLKKLQNYSTVTANSLERRGLIKASVVHKQTKKNLDFLTEPTLNICVRIMWMTSSV